MNLEQLARALQSLDAQAAETVEKAVEELAALRKDNDDIHELAEHYRVENGRLREALEAIMRHQHLVAGEFGAKTAVHEIARAALEPKQ